MILTFVPGHFSSSATKSFRANSLSTLKLTLPADKWAIIIFRENQIVNRFCTTGYDQKLMECWCLVKYVDLIMVNWWIKLGILISGSYQIFPWKKICCCLDFQNCFSFINEGFNLLFWSKFFPSFSVWNLILAKLQFTRRKYGVDQEKWSIKSMLFTFNSVNFMQWTMSTNGLSLDLYNSRVLQPSVVFLHLRLLNPFFNLDSCWSWWLTSLLVL